MPVRFLPSEAGVPRSKILTLPCKKRCLMAARSAASRASADTPPRSQGPPPRLLPAELTVLPPRLGAMMLRCRSDDVDRNAAGAVAINSDSAEAERLLAFGSSFMLARKRRMFLGRVSPLPLLKGMATPSSSCGHEAAAESWCCCGADCGSVPAAIGRADGCRSGLPALDCGADLADCGLGPAALGCGDGCWLDPPSHGGAP